MRQVGIIVLVVLVTFLFSTTTGLAQAPKPCDEARSEGARLLDSASDKATLDERLTLLKPASDVIRRLATCRQEDFRKRDIVMVNVDADIESQLSAFMYDQASDLARHVAGTLCH